MKHIHVRNLDKYQDGYKDRRHYWAKIYLEMIQGNPESEMLNEIDFSRLVKLIVLESCTRNKIPASEAYLSRKGFDFKLRKLDETLKSLSHFIEVTDGQQAEPDADGYVYFLKDTKKNYLKIGYTKNLEVRLAKHKYLLGAENFEFICAIRGTRVTEREHHKRFEASCIAGEWFKVCNETIQFLEELLTQDATIKDVTETHANVTLALPREEESREEKKELRAREGFKKPKLEELKELFRGKGFPAEAEKFFGHYEANGWRVGRNPMRSVQHAVANWIRNMGTFGKLEAKAIPKRDLKPNPECAVCGGTGKLPHGPKCWCWS